MMLSDMKVKEYLSDMSSDKPAPGGGSASAFCGAQGAALIAMVAGLSMGRKKYAEFEDLNREVMGKAAECKERLMQLIDDDTAAYNSLSDAFKLPKETEEEKKQRKSAIADATLVATKTPYRTMEGCLEALELADMILGKSNTNAASDLGVAVLNLQAACHGAWLNVQINAVGNENAEFVQILQNAESVAKKVDDLSRSLYNQVKQNITG